MKQATRQLIRAISFLVLGMALLLCIQGVMSSKWFYPSLFEDQAVIVEEFYQLSTNVEVEIQAAFLGTSNVEYGIDPMAIYDRSGIVTIGLATANQPIDVSHFLLAELLRQQQTQVVLFDVGRLFNSAFDDPWYRAVMDNASLSLNKVKLAKEYASNYPIEKQAGSFLGVFFPIYRYHSRWSELSEIDFSHRQPYNCYRKGYYLNSRVVSYSLRTEWLNKEAEMLVENRGWIRSAVDGVSSDSTDDSPLYEVSMDEAALSRLYEMKRLCDEHGAKLVLLKVPAVGDPQYYSGAWTRLRSQAMKNLAEEIDVDFLDLFYDTDVGIDWGKDTPDGGVHLNYNGAAKISNFLADYLEKECGLAGSPCEAYEEDMPIYRAMCAVAELQMTDNLIAYLGTLSRRDNTTIFLSVADDMMTNLTSEAREALRRLGLQTDFDSLCYSDAFLAVVENGVVRREASSNRRIAEEGVLSNGQSYQISSCGWLVGTESKVVIDGTNYSLNHRGINVVALDNASGKVLDSVAFDTWDVPKNQSAIRNNSKTERFLRKYEQYLMIQDAKNGIGA